MATVETKKAEKGSGDVKNGMQNFIYLPQLFSSCNVMYEGLNVISKMYGHYVTSHTCPRQCVINLERYVTKRVDDLSHVYFILSFYLFFSGTEHKSVVICSNVSTHCRISARLKHYLLSPIIACYRWQSHSIIRQIKQRVICQFLVSLLF